VQQIDLPLGSTSFIVCNPLAVNENLKLVAASDGSKRDAGALTIFPGVTMITAFIARPDRQRYRGHRLFALVACAQLIKEI
jgi:hypothetical protein